MSTCTWEGCGQAATKPQIAKSGKQWANLCEPHDAEFDKALETLDMRVITSKWVIAQGGAKVAAARVPGFLAGYLKR